MDAYNSFMWVLSNFLILYIGFALIVFLTGYWILFDPKATTAGRFVYRFALSLLGVMLLVIIGVWVNPAPGRSWWEYDGDILWWRPTLRFAAYLGVAYTITSLAGLLAARKWWPHTIETAPEIIQIVKPRDRK